MCGSFKIMVKECYSDQGYFSSRDLNEKMRKLSSLYGKRLEDTSAKVMKQETL